MTENTEGVFNFGGQQATLAELANLGYADFAAVRSTRFPAGNFDWIVKEASLEVGKAKGEPCPIIKFKFECENVRALADEKIDPATLIGKAHTEIIYVRDVMEDFGRAKAALVDMGVEADAGAFEEVLHSAVGFRVTIPVKQTPNPNDKSELYSNMRLDKIKPVAQAA